MWKLSYLQQESSISTVINVINMYNRMFDIENHEQPMTHPRLDPGTSRDWMDPDGTAMPGAKRSRSRSAAVPADMGQ